MSLAKSKESINENAISIIHEEAYRNSKSLLRELAQDDPASILRGMKKLSGEDRRKLKYLEAEAYKWIDISRKNILDFLSI